jgi:asparagine synthase (glutamine-hydrolysing)
MSIQFGRWNFDHAAVDTRYLAKRKSVFGAYTSDARFEFLDPGIAILYDSFHTTKEMHNEKQPLLLDSGVLLTWDGRLDNRADLLRELGYPLPSCASDAAIVGASYHRWQQDCFAKLVGDWALSLWSPAERLLLLAKDFSGVRHLYYRLGRDHMEWCTVLEGLVIPGEASFNLEGEYLAGWLGAFPQAHLTPYRGVFSVAPSTYVSFRAGRQRSVKFWDFRESHRIRYSSDAGYEEHFRALFAVRQAPPSRRPPRPRGTQRRNGFVVNRLRSRRPPRRGSSRVVARQHDLVLQRCRTQLE